MRNESGYGTVSLIDKKSKRRKPYRVQIQTGWTDEGKPIRKTLGYTETRAKGKQMLAEYHNQLYDIDLSNTTFEYLYEKWFEYKKGTNLSESTLKRYKFYKNHYENIKFKKFIDITREDLQYIIDEMSESTAESQRKVLSVYSQIYRYCKGNNIKVGADVSILVNIKKSVQSTMHKPFTDEEIQKLWNSRNDIIDIVLIGIYTGLRPNEFFKISEVHDNYFITGSKTESGKNRVIPLNNKIKDIFQNLYNKEPFSKRFSSPDSLYQLIKREFKSLNLGSHSPYDCRHTFATLMARAKADEHCTKLIMGHRINDLTKRVYTHKLINELICEINKI